MATKGRKEWGEEWAGSLALANAHYKIESLCCTPETYIPL